ncbi:MAG: histidine kinase N-terminal 7TM domain-containing protein [Pseudomonadota bacterium]
MRRAEVSQGHAFTARGGRVSGFIKPVLRPDVARPASDLARIQMTFIQLLMVLLPAGGALAMMFVAAFAFNGPRIPGRREFGVLALVTGFWCAMAAAEYLTVEFQTRKFFGQCVYIGAAFTPVAWFVFTVRYLGVVRLMSRLVQILLCLIPVLTVVLAFTTESHGLIWSAVTMTYEPLPDLVVTHGDWFVRVHTPYSYCLFLFGIVVLIAHFFGDLAHYRRQILGVILSSLTVFFVNIAYLQGTFNIYGLDPTPMMASVFILGVTVSLFRGFLGLAPLSYREVFMVSADGVIMMDAKQRIVDINPAAEALCNSAEPVGKRLQATYPWLLAEHKEPSLVQTAQHNGLVYSVRQIVLSGSGGQVAGSAILLRDVTGEHRERAALQFLARIDSLTRVLNRGAFSEFVQERLEGRSQTSPLVLLFVDLDGFKAVNDEYGHRVGDQVLVETTRRVEKLLRPGDVIGRIGGDEFVVALDRASLRVADALAERLRGSFTRAMHLGEDSDLELRVGISIGSAVWPFDGKCLEDLLEVADQRMYQNKRAKMENDDLSRLEPQTPTKH